MRKGLFLIAIFTISIAVSAQRPPRPGGFGGPPRGAGQPEWVFIVDVNKNGRIEAEEFRAAADAFFKKHDANENGILEESELPAKPAEGRPPLPPREVPPFLFLQRGEFNLSREEFDEKANLRFIAIDVNGDKAIDFEEIRNVRPPDKPRPPNTAMAQFIGAEMRFGDKLVKDAPFSAETVREETKRLFDGSVIKNQSRGAIYRDGAGRIRQEQPFENIGGFAVVGENNQPKKLIQIVDMVARNAFSLDLESKTFFKIPFLQNSPLTPKGEPKDAKKGSLGTKTIEGVKAEGTRLTIEIPVGQIGNDKPIYVVTEKWFSPELQMVVLSKHTDPFIGEVTFQLVNIKKGEPAADLFKVPNDFRLYEPEKNKKRVN